MIRRDSGKQPSSPVTQIRPLTCFNFLHHHLWPPKNPVEIHGSLKCSLHLSCQHIACVLILAISLNRKKKKNKQLKMKNLRKQQFPLLSANCLGNSVDCFRSIQQFQILVMNILVTNILLIQIPYLTTYLTR